jgi:hypothetical protein
MAGMNVFVRFRDAPLMSVWVSKRVSAREFKRRVAKRLDQDLLIIAGDVAFLGLRNPLLGHRITHGTLVENGVSEGGLVEATFPTEDELGMMRRRRQQQRRAIGTKTAQPPIHTIPTQTLKATLARLSLQECIIGRELIRRETALTTVSEQKREKAAK